MDNNNLLYINFAIINRNLLQKCCKNVAKMLQKVVTIVSCYSFKVLLICNLFATKFSKYPITLFISHRLYKNQIIIFIYVKINENIMYVIFCKVTRY